MNSVYGEFLLPFPETTEHIFKKDRKFDKAAVIVDNRGDDDFWFPRVVNNFHLFNPDWNYYHFKPTGKFGPEEFSGLLKNELFWEFFKEDKILIFQSDCICCQTLDPKFLKFDYIGAPCNNITLNFIMNGGLSIRDRNMMLRCIRANLVTDSIEDMFFTKSLRLLNANLPSFKEAVSFSVESFYDNVLPFGVHGTDKNYHSRQVAEAIVEGILENECRPDED